MLSQLKSSIFLCCNSSQKHSKSPSQCQGPNEAWGQLTGYSIDFDYMCYITCYITWVHRCLQSHIALRWSKHSVTPYIERGIPFKVFKTWLWESTSSAGAPLKIGSGVHANWLREIKLYAAVYTSNHLDTTLVIWQSELLIVRLLNAKFRPYCDRADKSTNFFRGYFKGYSLILAEEPSADC